MNAWMVGWLDEFRKWGRIKIKDFKEFVGRVIMKKGPGESMLWWNPEQNINFKEERHCLVQHWAEGCTR